MPGACSAAASSARLAPGGRGRRGAAAPDGAHAAVHHVRRRHAVRARARLRKAGVGSGAAPGGQQRTARARWPAAGTRRGMRPPLVVLTQPAGGPAPRLRDGLPAQVLDRLVIQDDAVVAHDAVMPIAVVRVQRDVGVYLRMG